MSPRPNCLFVQIAIDSIRTHSHWTGVHRVPLKARRNFTMSKIAPAIRFAQPLPTARGLIWPVVGTTILNANASFAGDDT
jgi:hypothetical protein